jgi:hypothetical protein
VADAYRNIPLEQRISSIREGDVTHYGEPLRSRRLTVQPRKNTDAHYHWQEGSATGVDPDAPKVWAPIYPQTNQDITTRLRIIHCAADDLTPCGTCLTCQAADEIERLRAMVNELCDFIDSIPSGNDALAIFLEARRG